MKMFTIVWLAGLWCGVAVAAGSEVIGPALVYSTEGEFEDVKADLVDAIESRGLVISLTSHASTMLERTAEVVGVTEPVYAMAEIVMFCRAAYSHALVAASPHNIVLCPSNIAIYSLRQDPQRIYLSMRVPYEGEDSYVPMAVLAREIIEETVSQ